MTREVVAVGPRTPLADAVALMESRSVKRLPVLDQGRLIGIVSRANLLGALLKLLPHTSAPVFTDVQIRERVLAQIGKLDWLLATALMSRSSTVWLSSPAW